MKPKIANLSDKLFATLITATMFVSVATLFTGVMAEENVHLANSSDIPSLLLEVGSTSQEKVELL